MRYDFDTILDRRNTHSLKWDRCRDAFGLDDVIPMWVADMDFAAPPSVVKAIERRASHGAYGYVSVPESFWESAIAWLERRHGWAVDRRWLHRAPGVVPALSLSVNAFTDPGDGVVVQPPVYYPFFRAIEKNGRRLVRNPLVADGDTYRMDLADFDRKIDDRTRLLILCSPHNPVGRVWTREELETLGEICVGRNLVVLSDEIHMDLALPGHTHVPLATISPALAERTVTCIAPSKTFNLAGLSMSLMIASNSELLARYEREFDAAGLGIASLFGTVALEEAYRSGDEWLDQLREYIAANVDFADRFIRQRIPALRLIRPEGTYLALMDCRRLGMTQKELDEFFLRTARVYFDSGPWFGEEATGFERINLGCPRATLAEALGRIERAISRQLAAASGSGVSHPLPATSFP
jgi:cystathionine beta-lyase